MRSLAAALSIAVALAGAYIAAAKIGAPGSAPATVETRDDGWFIHRPSGIVLPREIRGPQYTHQGSLKRVAPDGIEADYGAITVTIGAPALAADPAIVPPGRKGDPQPPFLPALLFWGDAAQPLTVSLLHDTNPDGLDWISFTIVVEGWQVELSASYPPEARQTVIKTAEAVWANLASGNESEPR